MSSSRWIGKHNCKTDLIDVLNFASAVNLPTTKLANKIYVTNDDNKIYRLFHKHKIFTFQMSVAHDKTT
jgi:hypothetical protein